jgi:hypothetical protein
MRVKRIMTIMLTALMLFGSIFPNMSLALQPSNKTNDVVSASSESPHLVSHQRLRLFNNT